MSNKNCLRAVVLAAICAWPGVETYRYAVARQQLEANQKVEQRVTERYLALRAQNAQVAKANSDVAAPNQ